MMTYGYGTTPSGDLIIDTPASSEALSAPYVAAPAPSETTETTLRLTYPLLRPTIFQ